MFADLLHGLYTVSTLLKHDFDSVQLGCYLMNVSQSIGVLHMADRLAQLVIFAINKDEHRPRGS